MSKELSDPEPRKAIAGARVRPPHYLIGDRSREAGVLVSEWLVDTCRFRVVRLGDPVTIKDGETLTSEYVVETLHSDALGNERWMTILHIPEKRPASGKPVGDYATWLLAHALELIGQK